jgi:DNA-binding response OmpR family regulator
MDGIEVARHLRASGSQTPILMLTACDAVTDIVRGLDAGADDYLTKPFSLKVLLARLRSISRRAPDPWSGTEPYCSGGSKIPSFFILYNRDL